MLSDGVAGLVETSVTIKYPAQQGAGSSGAPSGMDAIVLFNLESFGGGNNNHQFLAVFEQGSRDDLPPDWPFRE